MKKLLLAALAASLLVLAGCSDYDDEGAVGYNPYTYDSTGYDGSYIPVTYHIHVHHYHD